MASAETVIQYYQQKVNDLIYENAILTAKLQELESQRDGDSGDP